MKFMQIKPQKCGGTFKESLWTDPAWSAEDKFDGDRRIAQFCWPTVRFTGTRESVDGTGYVEKSSNLPQLGGSDECLRIDDFPISPKALEGTVLDGEIVAPWADALPGGSSKHVTAIMGSSPERAVALQRERGWLEYRVFDCLWYKGQDMRSYSLKYRRESAVAALSEWKNPYAKMIVVNYTETRKRAAWSRAREGLVFKHKDHTYGDERLWVKLKKEATADVVVIGYKPGKGQHAGKVGAIIFGQHIDGHPNEVQTYGTARGFDFQTMNALTAHPKKYMGRVFRIKHNGREPTGAFRHPRFDGWREDKDPKDCVYDPEES